MLFVVELAFSGFASPISLLLNRIMFCVFLCVCLLFTLFDLFGMLGLVGKRGEASRGGYLLRGARAGWKTIFGFVFI